MHNERMRAELLSKERVTATLHRAIPRTTNPPLTLCQHFKVEQAVVVGMRTQAARFRLENIIGSRIVRAAVIARGRQILLGRNG